MIDCYRPIKIMSILNYFGDTTALLERVLYAQSIGKQIVFIVGSPLTAPLQNGDRGVPSVNGIIQIIKDELSNGPRGSTELESSLAVSANGSAYQSAFEYIMLRRGPDFANRIIRTAVLKSYDGRKAFTADSKNLLDAEADLDGWILSPGVSALGKIVANDKIKKEFSTILTTNFDPLIQIAIKRAGGSYYTTSLHREGNLAQTTGEGTHVVHLHGSWRESDTLHTERQLKQDRKQLRASLTNLVKDSLVVLIAYGGWDDIITQTLSEIVSDDTSYPEIAWSFYSDSPDDISAQNCALLKSLAPGIDRGRISLFLGVNCHDFFPALNSQTASQLIDQNAQLEESRIEQGIHDIKIIIESTAGYTSPVNALPKTDMWFGRENELNRLDISRAKVIFVTGIGGQGKSSLAREFLSKSTKFHPEFYTDWKDCREQGNTINLAIASAIERASGGAVSIAEIAKASVSEMVSMLKAELGDRSGVIVFDNVDYYVDLESSEPLGTLATFIDQILGAKLSIKFVFTARPNVSLGDPEFLQVRLAGLTIEDAKALFEYRYAQKVSDEVFSALYSATAGHPLWLSIIAVQCAGSEKSVQTILESFRDSGIDLPRKMLRNVWTQLKPIQQQLLRTLAELERPETVVNLEDLTDLTFSKLSKSLNKLRSLCLIEEKETSTQQMIELHPLIRQFIREDFPKSERRSFISKVIIFIDRKLSPFKKLKENSYPETILDMWVHKIDLYLNSGAIELAIENLDEILLHMDQAGLASEICRLSKRIFTSMNWVETTSNRKFDGFFNACVRTIIELEGEDEADKWLNQYERCISGKGAQYINFCDLQSYKYWFNKDFQDALMWGNRGVDLLQKSQVDTTFNCRHTLALAQRDSGDVDSCLSYFLNDLTYEQATSAESSSSRSGQFFGNLGRCFHIQGDLNKALRCYNICAKKFDEGQQSVINNGYIRYWVGQALEIKGRRNDAVMFFIAAATKWRRVAPLLAKEPLAAIILIQKTHPMSEGIDDLPEWKCENRFLQWVQER